MLQLKKETVNRPIDLCKYKFGKNVNIAKCVRL